MQEQTQSQHISPRRIPYLIGLTGGIACGKSVVVTMLRECGACTIDADEVARNLQQPGTSVYRDIVAAFGSDITSAPDGPLDRKKLAAIVFQDPALLRHLESLIHPAVKQTLLDWLDDIARNESCPVAVVDAIKLLETGWKARCDAIWVVTAPPEQQIARLMHHRGMSREEAEQRIASQPPQADRLAHATVIIDNGGSIAESRVQVEAAWRQLPPCAT